MKANGVKSENQVVALLMAIGPETYEKPSEKPFDFGKARRKVIQGTCGNS